MPVTQFIDGNQFVQSVTSGQRNTQVLAQLQRELRNADRQFIFDQQADPFRLDDLRGIARNRLAQAEVQENTINAQIITARANASILRDDAELSQATNPIRIRIAELTGEQNEQRAILNRISLEQSLDRFGIEPAEQARDQAVRVEDARIAGVDTSKIPLVDYTKTAPRRAQVILSARERLGTNLQFSSRTPERDFQTGERLVEDLQLGGPISQALTQGGIRPEAQRQLVQPYITAAETAAAATDQVGALTETNRKLMVDAQRAENRILELERKLAQQGPAAPQAAPQSDLVPGAPGATAPSAIRPVDPGTSTARIQPAGSSDVTQPVRMNPVLQSAPITPQTQAELLPIEAISSDRVFSVSALPSLVTGSGGFQFESTMEPAAQIGVSEGGPGSIPIPVVDPRGPTGEIYYAMMTQESRNRQFDPRTGKTIVSPAGAVGIGQLLPSTAKYVAERNGIAYSRDRLYNDAEYNSRLGKLYFDQLMKQFRSTTIAVAAYNMGPGNASLAIDQLGDPRRGEISEADWVQRLPTVRSGGKQLRGLAETRDYVRKVFGFYNNRRQGER